MYMYISEADLGGERGVVEDVGDGAREALLDLRLSSMDRQSRLAYLILDGHD